MSRKATLTTDRSEQAITQFVHFAQPREIIEQIMADSKKLAAASIHDFAKREIGNDLESDLRDRFALAALSGISDQLFNDIGRKIESLNRGDDPKASWKAVGEQVASVSEACWLIADGMMKARNKL